MLVSVIMPMYNSMPFIKEAIESVQAQTYKNWELLVIDDGSTDGSKEEVERFMGQDSRIKLLHNSHHIKMPSAPRNAGILAANGRFIAFLDSDDIWFPQKLEQQLPLFDDNRVAIVFSNYEKMDEHGHRSNRFVIAPAKATYRSMLCSNVIGNLTGIYDTRKVGKIAIDDIHHEDYVMWLRILKKGFLARNTGTTLAAYRVRSASVSSRKIEVCSWQWNIYRNIEHLSLLESAAYFILYAAKAFRKSII